MERDMTSAEHLEQAEHFKVVARASRFLCRRERKYWADRVLYHLRMAQVAK